MGLISRVSSRTYRYIFFQSSTFYLPPSIYPILMTFTISAKCFTKIKLHAYKYPQCEVTGVLLAHDESPTHLVETIPLFHQGTRLIPMLEVAFEHIQSYCEKHDLKIVGYYEIPNLVRPEAVLSPFAQRIGDKISQANTNNSTILLTMHNYTGELRSWTKNRVEDGWISGVSAGEKSESIPQRLVSKTEEDKFNQIVDSTLNKKLHYEMRDFDLWLDNPQENDFTNFHIENLLSMFTTES